MWTRTSLSSLPFLRTRHLQQRSFGRINRIDRPVREKLKEGEYSSRLQILNYPKPQLRDVNEEITVFDSNLKLLIRNLFTLMYQADGIGLSAPQVGINKRILIFNPSPPTSTTEMTFINPKIMFKSCTVSRNLETCLSFPRVQGYVSRSTKVKVQYQDVKGISKTIELDGPSAIIFQHEYDHLEGVLFIDHFDQVDALQSKERLEIMNKIISN